jgi:hypothetical protein
MQRAVQVRVTVEKTPKRAGGPHFFGFQPPKKCVGVAPALRHGKSCRLFFPR